MSIIYKGKTIAGFGGGGGSSSNSANIDLSNLSEIGQQIIDNKANIDFSNLSEEAIQKINGTILETLDNKVDLDGGNYVGSPLEDYVHKHAMVDKITNCITEIPQRIKLELNDGVLTLKAGSEIIIPNGFEADGITPKFDYVTVESDISKHSLEAVTETLWVINCFNRDGKLIPTLNYASLSTSTTSVPNDKYGLNYNPSTNLVYAYNNGTTDSIPMSLPLGIVTVKSDGTITSIDQVFNGFGYIGSTVWVDKGVKGLIPLKRTKDETLNNVEWENSKLLVSNGSLFSDANSLIYLDGGLHHSKYWGEYPSEIPVGGSNGTYYNSTENIFYYNKGSAWVQGRVLRLADVIGTSSITSFNPKQPFRAVDSNEFKPLVQNLVQGLIRYDSSTATLYIGV